MPRVEDSPGGASSHPPLGVGIVGMGFMGRVHCNAYEAARRDGYPCRVVAVCDRNAERRSGRLRPGGNLPVRCESEELFDPSEVRSYGEAEALLDDPRVNLVSICTHTDTHAEIAIRALNAGKHVLVEKPLSLRIDEAQRVADAAASAKTLIMPALCMRFWPGWDWLKECVEDGRYGRIVSATFHRLASPPGWASAFYLDPSRCGGALFDLHIHDADMIRWLLGDPDEVVTTGTLDHVTTMYRYEGGPAHVVAEGGWDHARGFPFRMRYVVLFERATADFDLGRDPPLLLASDSQTGESAPPIPVELEGLVGYDHEIRHLIEAIARGRRDLRATIEDAVAVTRLLEYERRSMEIEESVVVGCTED